MADKGVLCLPRLICFTISSTLTHWLEATYEMHGLASKTQVSLKCNGGGPHCPRSGEFVRHIIMVAATTKSASPNLASFLFLLLELPSGKFNRNDLLTSKIQLLHTFQDKHFSCSNSYHHSEYGGNLLCLPEPNT